MQTSHRRSNRDRTESTRAALIAAARTLFVANGYAETGTPEIVAAAKVTRGALYHHFTDKADLFRAVALEEAHAVARQIETDATHQMTPRDRLITGADAYFAAMAVPGRARLLLIEAPAVLPPEDVTDLHRISGAAELRDGLQAALRGIDGPLLEALADVLSAAFDRAALAVSSDADGNAYRGAMIRLLDGLIQPPTANGP